jgi:hypothetical protein
MTGGPIAIRPFTHGALPPSLRLRYGQPAAIVLAPAMRQVRGVKAPREAWPKTGICKPLLMALAAGLAHNFQELVVGSDAAMNRHVLRYIQLLLPHILIECPHPSR